MSSYMCSRTRSHTMKCGPSHTTTFTYCFEADASWGRDLILTKMKNQSSNSILNQPSRRVVSSRLVASVAGQRGENIFLAHANCTLCCAPNAQKRTGSQQGKKTYFVGCLMNVILGVVK